MYYLRIAIIFKLLLILSFGMHAQATGKQLLVKPFQNKVFIKEQGQFSRNAKELKIPFTEPVLYGVENAEFNAYFTTHGIIFQFPERRNIEEKESEKETPGKEEKSVETIWHTAQMLWLNANPSVELVSEQKVPDYYNYEGIANQSNINFVPAYKKIKYINLYPGVDAEFELSEEGGIKYKFIVQPNVIIPAIAFQWKGVNNISSDENGNLLIKSKFNSLSTNPEWQLIDHSPNAFTSSSHTNIPVKYSIIDSTVQLSSEKTSSPEGIVIDPWITNTSYPTTNRAYDIQEDSLGNVFVEGNTSNYQIQKYNSGGALIWTYTTYSIFLGGIAVDNPGNVYIVGGYSAGKRQKLDTAGIQQWVFPGLVEEWRLAFNYSKTILTVGGYFVNPAGNNLGKIDVNTGAVSNQIVYNLETRAISTDCNGDIYSLHVTFGSTGDAAGNVLRKTYANFTPAGSVGSGFLLSEAEPVGIGYAPCPAYSPQIFQGNNGIVVNGPYFYIYDGATLRRGNKVSLTFLNSVAVPNGSVLMCSGVAADLCGNIYIGTTNGIAKYDTALTYISTIATPGAVYDVILSSSGDLLACGAGFLGRFSTNCIGPLPLTATITSTNNSCEGANANIIATGGVAPYSYSWQPGGQTTATINNLTAGTYTYTVTDPFCHSYQNTVTINPNPISRFKNTSVCNGSPTQFTDSSSAPAGTIMSRGWNFGDGSPLNSATSPSYTYPNAGNYSATLIVNNNFGCSDTIIKPVKVYYNPVAGFTHNDVCLRDSMHFTNTSTIDPSTSIASYLWIFGDGSPTSNLKNPAHYYSTKGTYTVTLVTTTIDGCSNAAIVTVKVFDTPTSLFTFSNTCLANSAVFTNGSAPPTMGTTASWSWNFGDGSALNTTVLSPQHLYNTPGNYQVSLITHSSNLGCPDTLHDSITVYPMPVAKFGFTNVCLHDPINFNDSSTVASGSIATWSWNYSDGTSPLTTQNSSHTYTSPNTYNPTLIITTNNGCKDTATKSVIVHPLPVAQFSRVNVCDGTSVQFNDLSTIANPDVIQFWTYNFGDGNSGNTASLSHQYTAPGSYFVKLLTVTSFGCKDSITKTSIVHPNPVVDFKAPITMGCEPLCVNFTDTSTILTGLNAHWLWNVGDGSAIHTTPTFIHCYTNDSVFAANSFNVTLTVTSDSGCVTTKVKNNFVTVYPNPKASFIVHPESTTITDPIITFTDLSTGATIWNWNLGDNTSSFIASPAPHTYQDTGTYVVTLITSTQYSCKDTTHQIVIIEPDFMFYIPSAFTPDGDGTNDYFTGKGVFIKQFEMSIFDRWGNLIFFSDDINKPWDGTANHGTDVSQRDVYIYSIKITDFNKKNHSYKGTVTLVR